VGSRSGTGVQISISRVGNKKTDTTIQFGDNNCNVGNFTAIMQRNYVIFAHVNTPLLGYVYQNGGSGIDIVPALASDPVAILKAFNPANNFMKTEQRKKTDAVVVRRRKSQVNRQFIKPYITGYPLFSHIGLSDCSCVQPCGCHDYQWESQNAQTSVYCPDDRF
jgi:hypothetical protein